MKLRGWNDDMGVVSSLVELKLEQLLSCLNLASKYDKVLRLCKSRGQDSLPRFLCNHTDSICELRAAVRERSSCLAA
jgi:hypothetical protein